MEVLFGLGLAIVCGVLVGQDAAKRGMNPWGWGVFVAAICLVGLPMYLILRKPLLSETTSTSLNTYTNDWNNKKCLFCAETIKAEALICRYCGKDQPEKEPSIQEAPNKKNTVKGEDFVMHDTQTKYSPPYTEEQEKRSYNVGDSWKCICGMKTSLSSTCSNCGRTLDSEY